MLQNLFQLSHRNFHRYLSKSGKRNIFLLFGKFPKTYHKEDKSPNIATSLEILEWKIPTLLDNILSFATFPISNPLLLGFVSKQNTLEQLPFYPRKITSGVDSDQQKFLLNDSYQGCR